MIKKNKHPELISGWREWASLPEIGIEQIKVKLDTGAKTSSLHAFQISTFKKNNQDWVKFDLHPLQDNDTFIKTCMCPIIDYRWITSSNGQSQQRYIISTSVKLGPLFWPIDISLANRDEMGFRMLLGRDAIKKNLLVDAGRSYILQSN